MMTSPAIAVLLAAYNGEEWIAEQIKTILNQKNVNVHIYISIDVSADATCQIVEKLCGAHHEITLLPYGKRFGRAALNFYYLIMNAAYEKYDYIALSDQDDVWQDNKLISAVRQLEGQGASGYSSNVIAFWKNGKEVLIKKDAPQCEYDYLFEAPGPGCTFVLKRDFALNLKRQLAACDYLRKMDFHDWLIYAYARANNFKWIIDSNFYIMYRQHEDNQLGVNIGLKALKKRVSYVFSGCGIAQTMYLINFLKLQDNQFVNKWYDKKTGNIHYLILAFYAGKCRRRMIQKVFFFFACLLMAIRNPHREYG